MTIQCEWPPVYDFDGLLSQIKELVSTRAIFDIDKFYQKHDLQGIALCQGDVVRFNSPFPVIDSDGDISTLDDGYTQWVVIGNTCDLARGISDSEYSHISPLMELGINDPGDIISGLKAYSCYRKFYLPPWESSSSGYYLDFTQMCSVHKSCLLNPEQVIVAARMSRYSWLLFHSCIVRYLARNDGRHA